MCANIAVTKHVLLADEFVPYRPRLLSFHSLHVNAMKCIYVGFSLLAVPPQSFARSCDLRISSMLFFEHNLPKPSIAQ